MFLASDYLIQHNIISKFDESSINSFVILSEIERSIKNKIETVGTPLKEWDINIYRGILTGYNEAFIIDGKTKDELIAKSSKNAEIIRPILRGRDIKRYGYEFADKWLICTHNGTEYSSAINIDDYPDVKQHLDQYYPQLAKRQDKGSTPYNLRSCAYMDDFSKQKIVWARLMRISKNDFESFPRFSSVPENNYIADSLCFFTSASNLYLQGILNSEFAKYYFFNNIAILDNGGMQMRQQYVELMPIPKANPNTEHKIIELVNSLNITSSNTEIEIQLNKYVYQLYCLSDDEIEYIKAFLKLKKTDIEGC